MDEYSWIWVIIYMMPVIGALWLLLMWANHEDYKKEHNIKGWSDRDMNAKQLLVTTVVSIIVGTSGYLVGTYYGSIKILDTIYGNVENELDILETKLENVSIEKIESQIKQLKQKVLNKVPSQQDIVEISNQIDEINERILSIALEVKADITDLKYTVREDLNKTTTDLTNKVDNTITSQSDLIKKELEKMDDKVGVLYKELEEVNQLLNKAKETFLGKYIIK